MRILKEFREFAIKGNVIDMAIGIVIGTAFGAIVQSLVKDIIMPPFGYVIGKVDFNDLVLKLGAEPDLVTINYGVFLNLLINFAIIAFAMFMVVKTINRFKRKAEAAPAKPTKDQELLAEIRDLLKAEAPAQDPPKET